jgi:hypothetical protein
MQVGATCVKSDLNFELRPIHMTRLVILRAAYDKCSFSNKLHIYNLDLSIEIINH